MMLCFNLSGSLLYKALSKDFHVLRNTSILSNFRPKEVKQSRVANTTRLKQESAVLNPLYIGEIKLFSHKRYLHILLYIAILKLSSRLEEEQPEDSF